jgi:hypothetical protein
MFCLLYSPKQKIVKFQAQKQIGKSHVIDIFTSEDMENISLFIFQYLTLYYIINKLILYSPCNTQSPRNYIYGYVIESDNDKGTS